MTERQIFVGALEIEDRAARRAYVVQACGVDDTLRQRVEALLENHDQAGSFLDSPPPEVTQTANGQTQERPGGRIGPYKLLQQLGEGGMGTVFLAEQTHPLERKVALKIIKPGMDSRQVIARFEAERQALALMDHPNIAKVLDAGTTDSGRPYFVMELVKGVPITKYCDQENLTPRERLELFIAVCQAVQHAHQKGLIHRDLKPSNVLIALYDDRPVPKIIDFGVAKATAQRLTERTMFTEVGAIVGTLEYMAPEQAELNNLDIDTRADIYSLGVILYELLTGSPPFTSQQLRSATFDEMLRMIREVEPPRPSTKLSSSDELPAIAAHRRLEPNKLTKQVHGELDWIVMKCLEKERGRRYETANGLAMDVQRYLADEPVQACPPSQIYRLKKFLRRNKGPVLSATVVLLVLVGGIVGTTWGLVRAERARQSEAERADAERKAKETAEAREAEARAVLDFVENKIFAAARPEGQEGGLGREVTLRKAIEGALAFGEKSFIDQPLIEARLRMTLGLSFEYLGETKIAAEQYQTARTIYSKYHRPDDPDTLRSTMGLANSYADLGRHAEALKLHEETLALRQAKLGYDHPESLRSMSNLASSYAAVGRHADALTLREETLALMKSRLGPDHHATLRSMANLAASYAALDRYADALGLREETLALRKGKFGPDHPDTLWSMMGLADSYSDFGRHAEALELRAETLALRRVKLGLDHPETLRSMNSLATSYAALGRHADAAKLHEETLSLRKSKLGADHPDTLGSMHLLASSYAALGRHADAAKLREAGTLLGIKDQPALETKPD